MDKREQLTERQFDVLEFIRKYINKRGIGPSREEMSGHFGIRINAILDHMLAIERKGYIKLIRDSRKKRIPRGILVLPTTSGTTVGQNNEKQA